MDFKKLKSKMAAKNIAIEETTIVKNGVECYGIRICTGTVVTPVIYPTAADSMNDLCRKIEKLSRSSVPDFDLTFFNDQNNVREHIYLSIRRPFTNDTIITCPCMNTEVYMRIHVNTADTDESFGSTAVTKELLEYLNIDPVTAWTWAIENTQNSGFEVRSMSEVLGVPDTDPPLFIVTSNLSPEGAVSLMFPDVFREFCISHGIENCIILPSSTQECLVVPGNDMETAELLDMVVTVNQDCVEDIIQLSPAVYQYTLIDNMVHLLAEK